MKDLSEHYSSLATSYDEYWLYSDSFVENLSRKIAKALNLKPEDHFVDVGCGTGLYAMALKDVVDFEHPVICADPSLEMLEGLPANSSFVPVALDATSLLESDIIGGKFLMKEAVHHIDNKESLFQAIAKRLGPNDVFLILLLPPTIDYPLFSAALRRYEELQPHYNELIEIAKVAGLNAEAWMESLPLEIEKSRYLSMVAGRYMSLLSTFTDVEIEKGLAEIEACHPEDILRFDDTFVFLRLTHPRA